VLVKRLEQRFSRLRVLQQLLYLVQKLLDKHQLQLEGIVLGFSVKINPITVGIHACSS
jgi:hypothetical protein